MVMVQAINDHDIVNRKSVRFCWTLWITTTLTTFSWPMKKIFIFVEMSVLKNVAASNREPSQYSPENFTFCESYCLVWCSNFWGDRPLFLWRRSRQASNSKFSPLLWDASHISGTGVPETWCWKPDSLVSARRGNGSHCENCNASLQRDVSSSRDLTKRENWKACKIVRSQRPRLLTLGIAQGKVYEKKARTTVDLKQNIRDEVAVISPTKLQRVMQNFQKSFLECDNKKHQLTDTIFRKLIF